MIDELRDSTLALQHFYDVVGVERRTPLGTLFAATEQPFDRPVSVWVFDRLKAMGADSALLDRFEQLAYTASRLNGASAVRTLDVGRLDAEVPFVVMERLRGRDLRQHLASHGPLDVGATLRVVEQLCETVTDAHAQGIFGLGLDAARIQVIDPQRMIVRSWGHGLALSRRELLALDDAIVAQDLVRHLPPSQFVESPESAAQTRHERADVTTAHADDDDTSARDQHRTDPDATAQPVGDDEHGEPGAGPDPLALAVDPAAAGADDLYAVAAIAYECLSGVHPYFREDRDVGDGVLAILRESPASLRDHFAVAQPLAAVVHDALGRNPRARFDTPGDFASALRAAAGDEAGERADTLARPAWLADHDALAQPDGARRKGPRPIRRGVVRALQVAVALLIAGNLATGFFALQRDVRSYAEVPEFVPPAPDGEGVDLVIDAELPVDPSDPASPGTRVNADLYLVSTRGKTVLLGQTPYLLRNQPVDARLHLVLGGDEVRAHQLELIVKNSPRRTQIVRERVAPLVSPLRPVTAAAPTRSH